MGKCAMFLVAVLALVAALGYVVMRLWNALIPDLFHGPVVGFWQAAGLLVLCKILFGGLQVMAAMDGRTLARAPLGNARSWREKWREKWASMSPEERERLRGRFRHGWCGGGWEAEDGRGKDPSQL